MGYQGPGGWTPALAPPLSWPRPGGCAGREGDHNHQLLKVGVQGSLCWVQTPAPPATMWENLAKRVTSLSLSFSA